MRQLYIPTASLATGQESYIHPSILYLNNTAKQQIKTTIGNTLVRNTKYLRKLRILPPPGPRVSQELGSSLIAPSNKTGLLVPPVQSARLSSLWGELSTLPPSFNSLSMAVNDQGEPMESISRKLPD